MKRVWGGLIGFAVGLLILWPGLGWRLLVMAIFVLIGYLIGRYLEGGEELRERLKELISLIFR
ncbi:MAG: DUF2273 domain-containing protein [Candidatus Bipolaricaulia bacterium]